MTTIDETITNQGQNNVQGKSKGQNSSAAWQMISIGGVTGIALGAAGMYAANTFAASDSDNSSDTTGTSTDGASSIATDAQQATVDQGLSFQDAFTAARAEVGAGGVFLWHGQLYSTYTAEEWQSMSEEQRADFANNVQPLLGQQTPQPQRVTQHTTHTTEHTTEHTVSHTEETEERQQANLRNTGNDGENDNDKPEVHFLGVETREVQGQTMNIGHMKIDNVDVALVDMDNDMVFDVSVAD